MSQNRTVTVFRTSCAREGAASGAAHSRQNFARGGFSVPHRSQIIDRVYAANPQILLSGREPFEDEVALRERPFSSKSLRFTELRDEERADDGTRTYDLLQGEQPVTGRNSVEYKRSANGS
jgi:hypothetical protein